MASYFHPKTAGRRSRRRSVRQPGFSQGHEQSNRTRAPDPDIPTPGGADPESRPRALFRPHGSPALGTQDHGLPAARRARDQAPRRRARRSARLRPIPVRPPETQALQDRGAHRGRGRLGAAAQPGDPVQVRIAFAEENLRQRVKAPGDRWRPETKTWEPPLRTVEDLTLRDRIVDVKNSQM